MIARTLRAARAFSIACWCLLVTAVQTAAQDGAADDRLRAASIVVLRAAVIEGVDPRVGAFVDQRLEAELSSQGLSVYGAARGTAALQRLGVSGTPSLADQWRAAEHLRTDYALHAVVGARDGRYTLGASLACRDGRGPFFVRGHARHGEIGRVLAEMVTALLAQARVPGRVQAPVSAQVKASTAQARPPERLPPKAERTTRAPHHVRFASHNALTLGTTEDSFLNLTLAARVDYKWNDVVALGAGLGYANLEGERRRVKSTLTFVQLECRAALHETGLYVPLRLLLGYLQANGSVVRTSIGITLPVTDRLELTLDAVAPTFYMTPDGVLPALSSGFELALEL